MSLLSSLKAVSLRPTSGNPPESLVVLLHGLGADGRDLISLAPEWADTLPNTEFVAPDAPFPCDMAPYGFQWFSLQDRAQESMLAGARTAAPILDQFLDDLSTSRGVPSSRIALVGFSQGAMMAMHVGPRRAQGCAGIVAYSGALLCGENLPAEAVCKPPVLVIHGAADTVVPPSVFGPTVAGLEAAGLQVESALRPGLPHGIDAAGIDMAKTFLRRILA